jgi:hypothetical protein
MITCHVNTQDQLVVWTLINQAKTVLTEIRTFLESSITHGSNTVVITKIIPVTLL